MVKGSFFAYARKLVQHQTELVRPVRVPPGPRDEADDAGKIVVGDVFVAGPEVLEDFKSYLRAVKIPFDEAKFKESADEIRRELEREIASALWGGEEGIRAYRRSDPVVAKALEVMPEAAKFIE